MLKDNVEIFALVYQGEIVGYRFYNNKSTGTEVYDVQTENTSLSDYCVARLPLIRKGNVLLTKDELDGVCQPVPLRDKVKVKELIASVKKQ